MPQQSTYPRKQPKRHRRLCHPALQYLRASPRTHLRNLISCARDGGNSLINVGPKPDASIPERAVEVLTEVGGWLERNYDSIYATDTCQPWRPSYATFTRRGNTLYMHIHFWPATDAGLSGLQTKVKSISMLASKQPLQFRQDDVRVHITGLPPTPTEHPVTTLVIECDSEPRMNTDHELRHFSRLARSRFL